MNKYEEISRPGRRLGSDIQMAGLWKEGLLVPPGLTLGAQCYRWGGEHRGGSVPQPACSPLRRGVPALWTLRFAVGVSLPRPWAPVSKTFLPGALQQEEAVGRSTAAISTLSFSGLTWAETAQE